MDIKRSPLDWVLFATLIALWGSAYAFTRLAVSPGDLSAGFSPELIIPMRLTGGAILLLIIAWFSGQKWPAFADWKSWTAMTVMGLVGTATPFFAITHAQQTVDSSLAALYVAAAPLFVSIMAHVIFHDDRMTDRKILGIMVGFLGVAVLFGPEAVSAFGSASVTAQALCLMATFCYALSSIIARFAKDIPPLVFSAGFVSIGAVATWPFLLSFDFSAVAPSGGAIFGVIGLIIAPTATASVLYMILIQRTSASFVSLTGYLIPIFSALVGYLAFREVQDWNALIAFALILSGIWISQRSRQGVRQTGEKTRQ
jgi:drug/metabolite transporter (DMT)-like permease